VFGRLKGKKMDVSEIKRNIQYMTRDKMVVADLQLHTQNLSKKDARKAIFEQILDSADTIRREYGDRLERY
jgi:hypothetical protein